MTARIGDTVKLTYDADPEDVLKVGDTLYTKTGRYYVIVECRQQTRGKWAGRWHLRCLVVDSLPGGSDKAQFFPLVWNQRKRKLPTPPASR